MSSAPHLELGARGEDIAARYLERAGWRILARNIRVGHGELDIAAHDGTELVIVEVRLRSIGRVMPPEASVGPQKLRKLIRAARRYVSGIRYDGFWRIDLAAVTIDSSGRASVEMFRDITMGMEAERL